MRVQFCRLCIFAASVALALVPARASAGVTPAGDHFTVSLPPGNKATFKIGASTVTCSQSAFSGSVPTAPANQNTTVVVPVTTPTFNNGGTSPCTTSLFGATSNAPVVASGSWSFGFGTTTATLSESGGNIQITLMAAGGTCAVTIGPVGSLAFSGTWTNGVSGGAPHWTVANTTLPAHITGGFACPTVTSVVFSEIYVVTDTTSSPPTQISVF